MIDTRSLAKEIERFIECLKQERFYDAHEALEVLWFPLRKTPNDEVNLLRGYINASVSFELHKRGRFTSSQKVWKNFVKHQLLVDMVPFEHQKHYKKAQIQILKIRNEIEKNTTTLICNNANAKCSR